jgi:phosphate transport system substrate-binding protein
MKTVSFPRDSRSKPLASKTGLTAIGVALSAAFGCLLVVGCNGNSEDYSSKEASVATTNISTFGAAGSTFIAPLFNRWSNDYVKGHNTRVNYRSIGSGGGLKELQDGLLTFAATDAPLNDAQLKDMPPIVQIPVTGGPVCVTYNLPGLSGPLKLSGKTLAAIYAGQVKRWQDASIAHDNPGVKLPALGITVTHRLDGSGTTSIFTSYLSAVSPSWAAGPGHGLAVAWPTGIGQNGSVAVLAVVKQTVGAVGYMELRYAQEAGMPVASIQNKAGEFIAPSPATATLAIEASADALAKDLRSSIVDPPAFAKGAYPISGLSFMLFPKDNTLAGQQQSFKKFVTYCLTDGQNAAEEMSYSRLPPPLLQQGQSLLSQLTENGKPVN